MPLWFWLTLGYALYRKWRGEPVVPAFFRDAFSKGAMLVKTETGHLVAVPLETPVKGALQAAEDGDLHPDTEAVVFASVDRPSEILGDGADLEPQVLMGGFGDPWNQDAGVGDDWEPGLYGLLRSTSISARRRV